MENKGLRELHDMLAQELLGRIRSGEAAPSDLSVARQFLKDNGIDANTGQSEPLLNLAKVLPFDPKEEITDVG